MNIFKVETPFYTRLAMVLISLISLGYLSILGKELLCPLLFSFLFAILLLPVAQFFERKLRIPRSAAAGLSVVLFLVSIVIVIYTVGSQISSLAGDWPMFKEQVMLTLHSFQQWVADKFHVDLNKQLDYFNNATKKIMTASTAVIGTTVLTLSSIMLFLVFTMIDTFFLLFYRRLIMKFLVGVFREENSVIVYEIVAQIQFIIRKYIVGLLLEMSIVAGVICLAFWLLGIKYAFLLGIITGLFNIIPYIGIFTALLLSALITFATGAAATKLLFVVITVVGMHLIDSNVLLPLIVGSKVRINALITLIAVIVGEMMWGISGMFLAIPVVAITKIIFDRIESLKPWGILLGDEKDEKKPGQLLRKIRRRTPVPVSSVNPENIAPRNVE